MKLSKGETLFLIGILLSSSLFIIIPRGHSEGLTHRIQVEEAVDSIAEPAWALYQMAVGDGITPQQWDIYWKGTLQTEEQDQLLKWMETSDSFNLIHEGSLTAPHQSHISEQRWKKDVHGTTHQLQVFSYPQEESNQSSYIYTWTGRQMDSDWRDEYYNTEQQLMDHLQQLPQIFTCIEGFTNDKLDFELSDHDIFYRWMTKSLNGEITHRVSDQHYVSVNGYIPTWGQQVLSSGDTKINLQLSARYNALDQQTRVTIGYPLILTEH